MEGEREGGVFDLKLRMKEGGRDVRVDFARVCGCSMQADWGAGWRRESYRKRI